MPDPRTGPNPASRPGPGASPEAFLQTLRRSRLLDPGRIDAALAAAAAPVRASARRLADHLIGSGDLTHYQAEKLLQGRWQGLVLGPYRVLAPLGRGGMGTVYLAATGAGGAKEGEGAGVPASASPPFAPSPPHPPDAPHLLALKVLPPKRAREEGRMLARFRREMDLGRQLDHPNVTRTFDAGEIGGVHYIAMEYVPGQSLRQLVAAGGPLSVADTARVFADVAAGLAHAHDRGLIHRDLKPSNIMVTPDGRAKILDLGLALMVGEDLPDDPSIVGGQGYVLGTMDYIAPEQTTDPTTVGPPSDLYALGCSVYFALTGMPPFPGGTSQQKIRWHRTEQPPPVTQFSPAVPPAFARLVEQLMAKRPEDRPAPAEVVRGLLLPWAGDSVARAAAVPAPHSDQEAVAGVDSRSNDPSLWDAAPVPAADVVTAEVVEPVEAAPAPPRPAPPPGYIDREADGDGRTPIGIFAAAGCAAVAVLTALAMMLGLLSRL